jgi:hypothetical protein
VASACCRCPADRPVGVQRHPGRQVTLRESKRVAPAPPAVSSTVAV